MLITTREVVPPEVDDDSGTTDESTSLGVLCKLGRQQDDNEAWSSPYLNALLKLDQKTIREIILEVC